MKKDLFFTPILEEEMTDMPLIQKGVYIFSPEDKPYEVAATYQLNYFLSTALIAIDLIVNPEEILLKKYDNAVQYYHYHVDHLFYLIGQINDRMIPKKTNKKDQGLAEIKNNQIEMNRNNYGYDELTFPILSNKNPRNIIEHLDSRNLSIIGEVHGVGGFNVLFPNDSQEMISSIKSHRELYPYTLDLVENKLLFYDAQASSSDNEFFDIDLFLLREEIEALRKNVAHFADFLRDSF